MPDWQATRVLTGTDVSVALHWPSWIPQEAPKMADNQPQQPTCSRLRAQVFDERFQDPRHTTEERFLWDYFHIPNQYTMHRTQVGQRHGGNGAELDSTESCLASEQLPWSDRACVQSIPNTPQMTQVAVSVCGHAY